MSIGLLAVASRAAAAERPHAASGQPLPGQIVIDPDHPQWLKRNGGAHVFICGPGDPEGFLYRGSRNADGTRSGDQSELIEKLIRHGGNSIYMQIVRTHGGDAKPDTTQNPFIDSDPTKEVDPRILEQWETWFTRMDEHGILIYLFFYDDSARVWNTGDEVGAPERTLVETVVRRFKHHRNLIWVVGEESEERYTSARVNAIADLIRATDDHGHIVGSHHLSGTRFKAWQPGGALSHYSMQLNLPGAEAHGGALEALNLAAGRYQVIYAENTAMRTGVEGTRRHAWAVAMGGLMPMLLRMEIADTPVESLEQCRHLQRFFEATDFHTLAPHDELAAAETKYVLADPGRSCIGYIDVADGRLGLKGLPEGPGLVTWLDCITGRSTTEEHRFTGSADQTFSRPAGFGAECAAWVRVPNLQWRKPAPVAAVGGTAPAPVARPNQPPRVQGGRVTTTAGQAVYVQLAFSDDDGPGPYTYTIVRPPRHGTISGSDNDRTYTPQSGFVGQDSFVWKVSDGRGDSAPASVTIDVRAAAAERPDASGYFPPPESKGGWRKLESEDEVRREAGTDPGKLAAVRQWLLESDQRNFAAVVIRRGQIALEVERGNSAKTDARRVASVSKAVCATVLAIASDLSQRGGTPRRMTFGDPAFDFIPWAQPLSDPRKARVTVRQLLNHTSGICPESIGAKNDGTWEYILGHSGDSRTAQLAFDPGTASGYSTHALHHASLVCENVTGAPYDEFAIKHLFEPIGCEHWWFQYYEGGEKYGRHPSHGLGMPARDLARIAYCMLRGGDWNGRQVIPRWFVDETGAPSHDLRGVKELRFKRDGAAYSSGWERPTSTTSTPEPWSEHIPADARFKRGSGGQFIAFVPSLDLVVTRQTGGSGEWKYEEYLGRVCLAMVR
ncbi:MAG: serine hydrolase [Opitutaceae bacterium]|nr:serine hydrolase [Opitutaceae bacterium]